MYHLTHDIKEDDFNISNIGEDGKPTGQVEIIGWMYQYYNTEPKDEAFALLKKNVKITKERIPAATQLFTPDWIVRYMVENSVGRLWLEGHEDDSLKSEWKYYLDEAKQEADVEEQLKAIRAEYKNITPEEIKVIDPCMGSGHILVYTFDVLMQIYESYGYSQRDAAKSIVENNIYGLDIDDRAFQLAYFAIMMKARSYNRRFLTFGIEPNLCAIQESNGLQYDRDMGDFLLREEHRETLKYLLRTFKDAKEYGSILEVEKRDYDGFLKAWELTAEATAENIVMLLWYSECNQVVPTLAKQAKILSQKYEVVITNPPYMAISNGGSKLTEYVKKYHVDCKVDLFAVFIERCSKMVANNGYQSMITQHAWMFLSSYEKLRIKLQNIDTINMIHLGARAFDEIGGEVVQTSSFVFRKSRIDKYVSSYLRLIDGKSEAQKESMFYDTRYLYLAKQSDFKNISGCPIAYWLTSNAIKVFGDYCLRDVVTASVGIQTGDNEKFVRLWWEIEKDGIYFGAKSYNDSFQTKKWFPYNKGGECRKWEGNDYFVIWWKNDGEDIKENSRITGHHYQQYADELKFKPLITWSRITTGMPAFRYKHFGYLSDMAGFCLYSDSVNLKLVTAFCNSVVARYYLDVLAPTLNIMTGQVLALPYRMNQVEQDRIEALTATCIEIVKSEWDSYEVSWSFKKHPLLPLLNSGCNVANILQEKKQGYLISECYDTWEKIAGERFENLKKCEEEINRYFIDLYKLHNELIPDIEDKNLTIRKAELQREIKSLLSYAVGCILGRFSVDSEGVVYAGGEWNIEEYISYKPDVDGIIPITDEEYFEDDIVGHLCEWLKSTYGEENLEDNLRFIAGSIGGRGNTSREIIRLYFLNDFFKEHCGVYSVAGSGKRPIYWLFDSGKQNGFKALIYMHRYNADTIGNLRIDYLHRMERIYESEINRMQDTIDNSSNAREVTAASKRKEKLQRQLKECKEYDEKIGHLALSRIEIDLDDGVKVNYEKVQTANDGKKYQVLAKI